MIYSSETHRCRKFVQIEDLRQVYDSEVALTARVRADDNFGDRFGEPRYSLVIDYLWLLL